VLIFCQAWNLSTDDRDFAACVGTTVAIDPESHRKYEALALLMMRGVAVFRPR
jgi:hypothetical protein